MPQPASGDVRQGLSFALRQSAMAYGYTLSVWTSGTILIRRHGMPTTAEALLFLAGGVAAFALLAAALTRGFRESPPPDFEPVIGAGALQFVSAGAALGASLLIAQLHDKTVVWPCASFALTVTYLVIAGLQVTVVGRLNRR